MQKLTTLRDVIITIFFVIISWLILSQYDTFERLIKYLDSHEKHQLDELFLLLIIMGVFSIIFYIRRVKEALGVNENFKNLNKELEEKVISEVKKQKEKEQILFQQSKLAAMGEMIGNIAHQWRQPLSVISTAATGAKLQIEMDCLPKDELLSSLTAINTSAQYLSSTIDDFRDFFNPSNNKINEFNISETFIKTLNLVKAQFTAKDIEIIQNIEECEVSSIENELIQVLINILNNARDALITIENQRKLILINTLRKDNILFIEIKDNAGGIQEDIIDRIFEPYFTTKHQSQGTGIGLYMSKEIVEKHLNGELLVSNENYTYENVDYLGAKFTIEIADLEVKA